MKYKVVTADSVEGLSAKVNDALEDGWKCMGGVAIRPRKGRRR